MTKKGTIVRQEAEPQFRNCDPDPGILRVEERRRAAAVPVEMLASGAGISDRAYRKLKAGATQPKASTIRALEEALGRMERGEHIELVTDRMIIGEAGDIDGLRKILIGRRRQLRLTQLDVDELAGFQTGYTSKLELGGTSAKSGRIYGVMSLGVMLQVLGCRLKVVASPVAKRPKP